MKRLGGTDALFLAMETPSWHQHVAGLTVLDPGDRVVTYDDVVKRVAERLPYAPKFTWKLQNVPFGLDRPVWVDDDDFDVRRHVRRIGVPSPGGAKELGELAGNLASTQLDRRRPLWELWFIEGVAGGRIAVLMKYHHSLMDGVAGASLATVLLDLEPDATEPLFPPPPESERTAGPASEATPLRLVAESMRPDLRRPLQLARYVGGLAAKGAAMADSMRNDDENRALLRAPDTPFNGSVGPRRELAFASVAMADVQRLKEHHGVKVNDVVLAICAGTLRSYLEVHDALPEAPLVTGVPVSTREAGDDSQSNQITTMFVSLATDVADPVERLQAIYRSTASAKEMTKAVGARQIQSLGEVASPLILSTAIRTVYRTQLLARSPVKINTLVSNVPGPPVPLFLCGAKVEGIFPSSVILEGMGLNITVFSYLDRVDFGLHVDPDLVPDVWVLADAVTASLAELLSASGLGPPSPVTPPVPDPAAPVIEAKPRKPRAKAAR